MKEKTLLKLRQLVHFREYPFGWVHDPSMREFMADEPWENQHKVVAYLRDGVVLGYPMAGDLADFFDPPHRANPNIDGQPFPGLIPLTDGTWFWPAGLIYFIEKYNVTVPQEFIDHAARNNWRVDMEAASRGYFDFDY